MAARCGRVVCVCDSTGTSSECGGTHGGGGGLGGGGRGGRGGGGDLLSDGVSCGVGDGFGMNCDCPGASVLRGGGGRGSGLRAGACVGVPGRLSVCVGFGTGRTGFFAGFLVGLRWGLGTGLR